MIDKKRIIFLVLLFPSLASAGEKISIDLNPQMKLGVAASLICHNLDVKSIKLPSVDGVRSMVIEVECEGDPADRFPAKGKLPALAPRTGDELGL